MAREKRRLTLGAELEFELRSEDGTECYLPRQVGLRDAGLSAPIGVDGTGNIAEIRTSPGGWRKVKKEALGLYRALRAEYPVVCTPFSLDFPTGLHIHLGVQPFPGDGVLLRWVELMTQIGRLHWAWNPLGRVNSEYGAVDSYRHQPWGIEYRALPATLIACPRHFGRTLYFAEQAAKAALRNEQIFLPSWWEEYKEEALQGPPIPRFYKNSIRPQVRFWGTWEPTIEALSRELILKSKVVRSLQARSLVPVTITLTGLKSSRGEVYGSIIELPLSIPRTTDWCPGSVTELGVPWVYRTDPAYKAKLVGLLKAFLKELEKQEIPRVFKSKKRLRRIR